MNSDESDLSIIRRVLEGQREAYAEIVRRHQSRLGSILSFYCRSADEVEEFLQEAFVQAFSNLRQFDPTQPLQPWLAAIALNALRKELQRHHARKHSPEAYIRYLQLMRVEEDLDGSKAEERVAALKKCLSRLSQEQAELLAAKYQEDVPLETLARRLQMSLGALKMRLLRIRDALRECVQRHLAMEGNR